MAVECSNRWNKKWYTQILVSKFDRKRSDGIRKPKWKVDHKEPVCEDTEWIHIVHNTDLPSYRNETPL